MASTTYTCAVASSHASSFCLLLFSCTQIFRRWQRADARGRAAAAAERDAYQQQQTNPQAAAAPPRSGSSNAANAATATASSSTAPLPALPPPGSPQLRALVAVCEWAASAGSAGARPQDLATLYVTVPEARAAVRACGGARPYCDQWSAFLDFKFDAVVAGAGNNINTTSGGRQSAKQQRQMAKVSRFVWFGLVSTYLLCLIHCVSDRLLTVLYPLFVRLGRAPQPADLPTPASSTAQAREKQQQQWWCLQGHFQCERRRPPKRL